MDLLTVFAKITFISDFPLSTSPLTTAKEKRARVREEREARLKEMAAVETEIGKRIKAHSDN